MRSLCSVMTIAGCAVVDLSSQGYSFEPLREGEVLIPEHASMIYPEIWKKVSETPLIDTHEHFIDESKRLGNGEKFFTVDDWTVILGHYFHHDFIAAGMPDSIYRQIFHEQLPPIEKWKLIEPYWDFVKHTSYGSSVRHTIRILYNIEMLNSSTVELMDQRYHELKREGFYRFVLKEVANIESVQVNTLWDKPYNETENPELLMQDIGITGMFAAFSWSGLTGPMIEVLAPTAGVEVRNLSDWYRVIDWWFNKYGDYAVAVKSQDAYRRNIDYEPVEKTIAEPLFLKRMSNQKLTTVEQKKLEDHLFWYTIRTATSYNLPIKIHTGYYSGTDYMPLGRLSKNPAAAAEICMHGLKEGCRFVFLHMGYPYQQEMIALVKHFSNAYIDLAWNWILDFAATKDFLKQYLTNVPLNKICVFGGDYIPVELTVGHAYVARKGIAEVLTELVREGYYTLEEALWTAEQIMYRNARNLYGLDRLESELKDHQWPESAYKQQKENPWKKYYGK
ncbi:MAG: amidohydrolase family protein [Bacteroidales bacterium]|nr:amidohydrolase family protein [Bacteroidales bacterium]MCF8346887.1 amidohydrolase family protein [Bacteroidales bacterium]